MYGCESWTMKKAEGQRIDAFELWSWRRLLRVPWIARRSNQSILKEISPGCSLEGLMLKLKLQYFGHLICKELTHWKRPWCWEELGAGEEGDNRGWDGWMASPIRWTWVWACPTPGVGNGQGGLVCCSPWGSKESDTTERLTWQIWISQSSLAFVFTDLDIFGEVQTSYFVEHPFIWVYLRFPHG